MDSKTTLVTSVEQLLEATRDEHVEQIIVRGEIPQVPSLRLSPGQRLVGRRMARLSSFAQRAMACNSAQTTRCVICGSTGTLWMRAFALF